MNARAMCFLLASSVGLFACASNGDDSLFGGGEERGAESIPAGSFGGVCVSGLGAARLGTQDLGGACGMSYGGRGSALSVRAATVSVRLGDTGELAAVGGSREADGAHTDVAGIVQADLLRGATRSAGGSSLADAAIGDVSINLAGHSVTAAILRSNASASCSASAGASAITDLRIDGVAVAITGEPNQVVLAGPVRVVIDERVRSAGAISVSALHVTTLGTDVALAVSRARVECPCGDSSVPGDGSGIEGAGASPAGDGANGSSSNGGGGGGGSSDGHGAGATTPAGFGDVGDGCDEKNKCTSGNMCVKGSEPVVR